MPVFFPDNVITVGTSPIVNGTTLRLLYDNAGILGEAAITYTASNGLLTLTGNSIGGTSSGTGFLMALGYNVANNKQYWLGDPDYVGDANATFIRVISAAGVTQLGGVSGDNGSNRNVLFHDSSNLQIRSGVIGFNPSFDTILTCTVAATFQFGAADAASPIAQTLTAQSVVAGTSNTAGANWTIAGSKGTGTGAGGSIIFKTAPAGSTGTSQNALATAMIIDGAGIGAYADDAAAAIGGVPVGGLYRTASALKIRVA